MNKKHCKSCKQKKGLRHFIRNNKLLTYYETCSDCRRIEKIKSNKNGNFINGFIFGSMLADTSRFMIDAGLKRF